MTATFCRFAIALALAALSAAAARAQYPPPISGIYPHLAYYNEENECGTGAVVPWADRLWVITYGPHLPFGSTDKLYEIDADLNRTVRPESVGGTNANRFIHRESNQLIIGWHFIDASRNIRTIDPRTMPGRQTGNARHLFDPENRVYFATMEEGFYDVDVHTLDVKTINPDGNATEPPDVAGPLLPGYHGKGLFSSQGRLVYANNGERSPEASRRPDIESGCLAEWDGDSWNVVVRKQFCEVSGPGGIRGNENSNDPLWATGWDDRSLILMLLDGGEWKTFRLPKASHTYDGAHGWHTEWPRIREIAPDDYLMTMHGMFWRFPGTFSDGNRAGIRPLSSYLKIIGDFCGWNGRVVFGCDDAAKSAFSAGVFPNQGTMAGQSNSNLWFVDPGQLDGFGPAIGRGGPWKNDAVKAGESSVPFLFAGFKRRMAHIRHNAGAPVTFTFEADANGRDGWREIETVTVPAGGYAPLIFDGSLKAEWVRAKTDRDCESVTLMYQFANEDNRPAEPAALFGGLAKPDGAFSGGVIRPRGENLGTLHFAATRVLEDGSAEEAGYYEIGEDMELRRVDNPEAHKWLKDNHSIGEPHFTTDEASVLVVDNEGNRFRLPKGAEALQSPSPMGWPRCVREIVTERAVFNCQGHLYELPRGNSGGFAKIRPIATSNRLIIDMCSWRGMTVLSGVDLEGGSDHVIRSDDGQCALWFGTIDDLWKLGKPRGEGGPWKDTAVKKGAPSDPYLMTGYDNKSIALSHESDSTVEIAVEIDIAGDGQWVEYERFEIGPGQKVSHEFPEGFNAYWLRTRASADTVATAQLNYW